jgi:hypothetical protein
LEIRGVNVVGVVHDVSVWSAVAPQVSDAPVLAGVRPGVICPAAIVSGVGRAVGALVKRGVRVSGGRSVVAATSGQRDETQKSGQP